MFINLKKPGKTDKGRKSLFRRLLELLLLVSILIFIFVYGGQALCRIALAQIGELTNTEIKTSSVEFRPNGSVLIRGLTILPNREHKYNDAILRAETVYARFGIGSLLLLRPELKEININNFIFDAQQNLETGQWNVTSLEIHPPKGRGGKMPFVRLKNGKLQYSKVSGGQIKVAGAIPIDARFGLDEKTEGGYGFNITTGKSVGRAQSTLKGFWQPGQITITGGISSDELPAFEASWKIEALTVKMNYDKNRNYSLKLNIRDFAAKYEKGLKVNPALINKSALESSGMINIVQRFINRYTPQGQVDVALEASGNFEQLNKSKILGQVYCKDVSICHSLFPYLMEHITGLIDITEKKAVLRDLQGSHKDVYLAFSGYAVGAGKDAQYDIRLTSENMALDKDLYDALNEKQKELWSKFSPGGLAAVDYHFWKRSKTEINHLLAVELIKVDAVFNSFPYPLKNLSGKLTFDGNETTISDVISQVNDRRIVLNGRTIRHSGQKIAYDIAIKADNIPIDSTLENALGFRQKAFYGRFAGAGFAKIQLLTGRIWSDGKNENPFYRLSLNTEPAELNNNLLGLLPGPLKAIASDLQPAGKVRLTSDVNDANGVDTPDYSISIDCLGNSINYRKFPYPLKNITGCIKLEKNRIELKNITAETANGIHIGQETSSIKVDGQIETDEHHFKDGTFQFSAKDISADNTLGAALPPNIREKYLKISPAGRFDIEIGDMKMLNSAGEINDIVFSGSLKLKDFSLGRLSIVSHINAAMKVKGGYKAGEGLNVSSADFAADSLRIKNKSLTQLTAGLDYDSSQGTLSTRDMTGYFYGGRIAGNLKMWQDKQQALQYIAEISLKDADLKQFLSDAPAKETKQNGHSSGHINGSLGISGRFGDSNSITGRCRLNITDMQVGKLSPLAKVLMILKLTEPQDYAFSQMLVDAYINHNRLFFEQFDLSGRSAAFDGTGWMDIPAEKIDLILNARGSRFATDKPSLFQSLTEGIGRAVVRIEISGNVYDPKIETTTLPVIKDTLGIFGTKPAKNK